MDTTAKGDSDDEVDTDLENGEIIAEENVLAILSETINDSLINPLSFPRQKRQAAAAVAQLGAQVTQGGNLKITRKKNSRSKTSNGHAGSKSNNLDWYLP